MQKYTRFYLQKQPGDDRSSMVADYKDTVSGEVKTDVLLKFTDVISDKDNDRFLNNIAYICNGNHPGHQSGVKEN